MSAHELFPKFPDNESHAKFFIRRTPLTENQIEKIIEYSREDPEVRSFTSNATRFGSQEAYERFLTPEIVTYPITDETGNLLGFSWYRPKELPADAEYTEEATSEMYPFTKATRLYGEARGIGLALR
jgi:hypothetical protein